MTAASQAIRSVRALSTDPSDDQVDQFRVLASRYSEFARQAGVELVPFHDPSLPLFRALPPEQRLPILASLAQRVSICDSARAQGDSMANTPALTWAALRSFGLRPPSDLFSHITDESIIEMHNPQGVPIFQSFNYYRLCSYSLEELSCGHWTTLYDRPQWALAMLFDFLQKVYSGALKGVTRMEVPTHVVSELKGRRYQIRLSIQYGSPLFEQGASSDQPMATLLIDRAELVRTPTIEAPLTRPESGPLGPTGP